MRFSGSEVLRRCRVIPTVMAVTGALAFGAACSDDSGGGGGGGGGNSTTFLGVISADDGVTTGEITIDVATGSPGVEGGAVLAFASVGATGSHNLGGTSVALTGTYDDQTGLVSLTGGGYTIDGGFDGNNRLEGFFTGPMAGTFVTARQGNGTAAYCGTFTGDDDGTFSIVIDGNEVLGTAVPSTGPNAGIPIALDGVRSGNNIYIPDQNTPLITGTISGSTVSGNWSDGQGNSGTWSGGGC